MTRRTDAAIFALCLLACAGAECVPMMLALLATAGVLTIWREVKAMYYRTCPNCGANLDPGERCDCQDKKEAAPGATNTQDGKAEQGLTANVHASSLDENKEDCQV